MLDLPQRGVLGFFLVGVYGRLFGRPTLSYRRIGEKRHPVLRTEASIHTMFYGFGDLEMPRYEQIKGLLSVLVL